ncbi:MAG TPA: hypothetical protein VGQ20_15145 [Acidimicrobiales bacterium]|jgi:uncharacterized integral membrane protein|nr:hypothetical protein [Acidimicrobiales bacterium]
MELPSHPEADDVSGQKRAKVNWATLLVFGVLGVLLILMLILHLTGAVGPSAH